MLGIWAKSKVPFGWPVMIWLDVLSASFQADFRWVPCGGLIDDIKKLIYFYFVGRPL